MEDVYKEVYFDKCCGSCKYEDLPEKDDPCHRSEERRVGKRV